MSNTDKQNTNKSNMRSQISDKKQETKQPTKSESAKPKPYPLRSIDYAENPKDIITIERPIEKDS